MEKIELYILGYSCIVATIALLWNVYISIKTNLKKLSVSYSISGYFISKSYLFGLIKFNNSFDFNNLPEILIQITNISNSEIIIYDPICVETKKIFFFKDSIISKKVELNKIDFEISYPLRLLPGERIELVNRESEIKDLSKFKILIKDSNGKKYRSGLFQKKSINKIKL